MLAVLFSHVPAAAMWCSTCQQDVAEKVSPADGSLSCGKCGQLLFAADCGVTPSDSTVVKHSTPTKPSDALLVEDDWALEAELRGLEKLVGSLKSAGQGGEEPLAFHPAHAVAGWHAEKREPTASTDVSHSPAAEIERPKSHWAAWCVLSLGLATFACGAMLLIWSLVGQREDLWPVGMPLALLGQAGLVLGLILQLDGLWQTSRKTAQSLTELDGELARVRHATTVLTTSRTAPGQSFYAHMAQGAAPQLLLADLKGQLDLLAQQMAERR